MPYCINCGNKISDDFEFCPQCGACCRQQSITTQDDDAIENRLESAYTIPGNNVGESDINQICELYGIDKNKVFKQSNEVWRNKWVSFFLCLFLGFWGVHRFYEGKIVTGIIYFFTVGLFGIGIFIDLILILCKPNPYRVK